MGVRAHPLSELPETVELPHVVSSDPRLRAFPCQAAGQPGSWRPSSQYTAPDAARNGVVPSAVDSDRMIHEPQFAAEVSPCWLQTRADHRKHAELQLPRQSPPGTLTDGLKSARSAVGGGGRTSCPNASWARTSEEGLATGRHCQNQSRLPNHKMMDQFFQVARGETKRVMWVQTALAATRPN